MLKHPGAEHCFSEERHLVKPIEDMSRRQAIISAARAWEEGLKVCAQRIGAPEVSVGLWGGIFPEAGQQEMAERPG